jgi:hypothetical protein
MKSFGSAEPRDLGQLPWRRTGMEGGLTLDKGRVLCYASFLRPVRDSRAVFSVSFVFSHSVPGGSGRLRRIVACKFSSATIMSIRLSRR